ncbi:PhzF family phenazine biosynthesis protein [Neobacillus terrae]|uniref:PhzF family phenazine biosynthesis protein n=1 Tax=Neobacillus terrae TaxID=3034837 RepID=UPI001FB05AAF|nr:PhzF family phenazine biosynthesis protein [Neobacillus terrae]
MQIAAAQLGFSETAFILPSSQADYQIRYFTPKEEVDVCGHATVASFSLLNQKEMVKPGLYSIETKAGLLSVEIKENESVFLQQNPPGFLEEISSEEIVASLGIKEDQLVSGMSIQVVTTGLRAILIPVKTLDILLGLEPNMEKITDISRKYDSTGYHVFTLETLHGASAHCRNFAPLLDIPEESATGTSNAALACYLAKYRDEWKNKESSYTFEQGYSMEKPSELYASLSVESGKVVNINIGGYASEYQSKKILI